MATRIYVGNLPYSVTDEQLAQMFGAYGEVTEAMVAVDRDTGRTKGFGFVQMADDAAANAAIAALAGSMMEGRTLRVEVAQPRADRSGGRPRRDGGGPRW
jgi:RNA recognition motif-containing protein